MIILPLGGTSSFSIKEPPLREFQAIWMWSIITVPRGTSLLLLVRDCSQPHWLSCTSPRTMNRQMAACFSESSPPWNSCVCVCVCVCIIPFVSESTCMLVKCVQMVDFYQSQAHSIMAPWCWGHGATTSLCRWFKERKGNSCNTRHLCTFALFKSVLYRSQLLTSLYIK